MSCKEAGTQCKSYSQCKDKDQPDIPQHTMSLKRQRNMMCCSSDRNWSYQSKWYIRHRTSHSSQRCLYIHLDKAACMTFRKSRTLICKLCKEKLINMCRSYLCKVRTSQFGSFCRLLLMYSLKHSQSHRGILGECNCHNDLLSPSKLHS